MLSLYILSAVSGQTASSTSKRLYLQKVYIQCTSVLVNLSLIFCERYGNIFDDSWLYSSVDGFYFYLTTTGMACSELYFNTMSTELMSLVC